LNLIDKFQQHRNHWLLHAQWSNTTYQDRLGNIILEEGDQLEDQEKHG